MVEVHRVGVSALPVNSDDNLRLPLAGLAEVSDRFDPTTSPANLFRGLPGRARAGRRRPPPARGAAPRADLGTRLAWSAAVGLLLVTSEHVYAGTASSAARRRFTILSVCGQLAALLERALPWGDRRPVTV